jgi:hypothetical protein
VRIIAARLGWQVLPEEPAWTTRRDSSSSSSSGSSQQQWALCWSDTSVCAERILRMAPTQVWQRARACCSAMGSDLGASGSSLHVHMRPFKPSSPCTHTRKQRINHLPGMLELARKRPMARSLTNLAAAAAAAAAGVHVCAHVRPLAAAPPAAGAAAAGGLTACASIDFLPQTWQLPQQLPGFLAAACAAGRRAAFIIKPDAGCQVGGPAHARCRGRAMLAARLGVCFVPRRVPRALPHTSHHHRAGTTRAAASGW